jgi:MoxR-like ATPase
MDYPGHVDEVNMVRSVTQGKTGDKLAVDIVRTLLQPATVQTLRQASALVDVDDQVLDYAVRIVRKTREFAGITSGAGSRGSLALVRAARALALMNGRNYVTPDEVKRVAPACLRHRIRPAPELEIEGRDSDALIGALLDQVAAPRQ